MRRLQKILLRIFPAKDDVAIFLLQESTVVLSARVSDLGRGGRCVLSSLMVPMIALQENMMVKFSRLLIMIRYGDLFLHASELCVRWRRSTLRGART